VGFGKYVKRAFINRWNLLAFLGGSAFALLTGHPDVVLPVVMAAELSYLGLMSSHPKFQSYVEAQDAKQSRIAGSRQAKESLNRIMQNLPKALLDRFDGLRSQCLELRQIALELKHPGQQDSPLLFDDLQLTGLDRLLWIHLRLLYTQFALGRFLQKTSDDQILSDIRRLESQLKARNATGNADRDTRVQKAIEDNLETSRTRLANWQKARDNYELVKLEIDRLENKIRSLSEMAVNRQEPEFISGQVDQVAGSLLDTEKTMNELRFATGLDTFDEEPPELLRSKVTQR
jgi:hypothetical protein